MNQMNHIKYLWGIQSHNSEFAQLLDEFGKLNEAWGQFISAFMATCPPPSHLTDQYAQLFAYIRGQYAQCKALYNNCQFDTLNGIVTQDFKEGNIVY